MEVMSNVSVGEPMSVLGHVTYAYRMLFYLMTPAETKHERLEDVPSYLLQAGSYLPIYLLTEIFLLYLQRKRMPRWNDGLTSLCCMAFLLLPLALVGHVELRLYSYIHEHYRLVDLPWNSTFTWFCGVLVADLGFYVWHRAAHEVNVIWAIHQVHHTPEDFNVFTGARVPLFNRQVAIFFYLPGALLVPPSVFYTHYQLNYVFQFWIHTDSVPSLGVIEYVINTPSLHRVHHGRNRYCIDKNYGAVFCIWDRLFGTFQEEKKGEEIYYGLVHPLRSWDILYMQVHHLKGIWQRLSECDSLSDKLSVLFKGPGWYKGTPRLGLLSDIPTVPEDESLYDKTLPMWLNIYCLAHIALFFKLMDVLKLVKVMYPMEAMWTFGAFMFFSIINQGWILEHKSYIPKLEIVRALAYFFIEVMVRDAFLTSPAVMTAARTMFIITLLVWSCKMDMFKETAPAKKVD